MGGRQADRISIHAPAGGATEATKKAEAALAISIHAPAGGATLPGHSDGAPGSLFQFTPLREGRRLPRFGE